MNSTDLTSVLTEYPKAKVIRNYGLFGGIVGGLILFVYLAIPMSIEIGMSLRDSLLFFKMAPAFIIVGFYGGLLPALLAGYIISLYKIYFSSLAQVFPLFAIGFISTFLCAVWFMIGDSSTNAMRSNLLFCCNGGMSAVITGWFTLPRD